MELQPQELEIFSKLDSQRNLLKELDSFKEYDFLVELEKYITHLDGAVLLMKEEAFALRKKGPNDVELRKFYQKIDFLIFSILSLPQAIEQYLDKTIPKLRDSTEFQKLVLQWKSIPLTFFFKGMRNLTQHGKGYLAAVSIEERNENHPSGSGFSWVYEIPEDWWKQVAEEYKAYSLSKKRNPNAADLRHIDKKYQILKDFYDSSIAKQKNKVDFVITGYIADLKRFHAEIVTQFKRSYKSECDKYNDVITECMDIENWLEQHNVESRPSSLPRLI